MKISEIIKELQDYAATYGDIEVFIDDHGETGEINMYAGNLSKFRHDHIFRAGHHESYRGDPIIIIR